MRASSVRYALLGVLAVVAAVHLPALTGDWVYDDRVLIAGNPKLHDLGNLGQQITEPFWGPELGYWRPLTSVLISAGYVLGGGGTLVLHALALLVHLAAVAAAFTLARRLFGDTTAALLAALLFGLHPVQVEGVAWIAAINDPLQGLCALLAMNAWWRWRADGSPGRPWRAVAAFGAGALCKETGLVILPMLVLLDATVRPAGPLPLRRAYAPLLIVVVLYFVARMLVFGELSAGLGRTWTDPSLTGVRWLTLPIEMTGRFVELLVVPWPLTVFRSLAPPGEVLANASFVRAAFWCVVFVAGGVVALRRRWPLAQLGLGLVLVAIAPTIARVQSLGAYPVADRYLYVAVFGWALLLVRGLSAAFGARAAVLTVLALAVVYGTCSVRQTAAWHDQESLVAHGVARNPADPIVQFMLGELLLQRYRTTNDSDDLDRARAAFAIADVAPDRINSAGQVFVRRHKNEARLGLAWCLFYERQASRGARYDDVIARFEALVAADPNFARAWIGLGVARATAGDFARAEQSLLRAAELDPRSAEAHYNLGYFYATLQRKEPAREHLEAALRINPGDAAARALLEQVR